MYGLSDVIGSWKIMEICSARILFNSAFGKLTNSLPSKMAEPSTSPLAANKPIKAKAVCDLPEPLSPTIPSVLPALSVKFKSFTAVTTPSGVLKRT